ncbi:type IA DNA topoisomerase [Campylobacter jejuni]|uniref:DNA topoisomerase 3 n=1 Tax=Campylobacter jejuni TaxID=197 RepID=UPI0012C5F09D|nr:DNA topoisomerase 3 [Campylobacter jejuni]ECQ5700845.1 DNA topoisomerase III [Campylobacter jejuni]BEK04561.1 type IA DNA topoisomerase [Campylobacter jejuni]GML30878.1 type IA DNA topoisomerase [Campylobacter jejuni]GML34346.1 type IA DNA topoisomerase [Campylobacter jejuni]HDV6474318.1 DNA topoisomerase 3 [Campylobacter jejuni]
MRLFIAEKPELGRAIAEGLDGNYKSGEGYIQKGDNIVTWAFGHILELAKPEEYDEKYKLWKLEDLPLPIKEFKYLPKKESKKQLKIICDLIHSDKITSIVNCGDADDEGQILVDEIVQYSKTSKPVFRVLINDLTPKAVKEEIAKIKPNADFKGMSERGFARSQADWIVGINLTRAYTIMARKNGYEGVLSVGRVQTPILALIVNRDKEFENFKSIDYFSLLGDFNINNNTIKARLKTEDKILDENLAKEIKKSCENQNAKINLKIENKKEYPPLPYNLLVLQAECAKLFGFSPDKTLEITQNLREKHKAITYNRSDCQYLPETMFEQAPNILNIIKENLNSNDEIQALIASSDLTIKSKAFNDANISAHYGIIPTQNKISSQLTQDELVVYNLIAKRFIIQFFHPREYQTNTINLEVNQRIFTATQNKTTKSGFRSLWQNIDSEEEQENNENDINDLSILKNGDIAKCSLIQIEKKQTKPRPYYTMTTLLKDLNSVAKYVSDERIKKLLIEKDKDKKGESGGIGTPATRSNHIKTLIEREYIEVSKDKKQIIKSTKKGRDLIKLSPKSLITPDMTALWFEQQKMIEISELRREQFLEEITKEVISEIQRIDKNQEFKILDNENKPKIQCPQCNKGFLTKRKGKYGNFWGCSEFKQGCKAIYPDNKGTPNFETKQASNDTTHKCPQCNKGFLTKRKGKYGNFWGCSEFKQGCKAMYYDDNGKPKIINV